MPSGAVLYVAPEMIAHYCESHECSPPQEFVAAVLSCPEPGTQEYADAIRPFIAVDEGPG